MPTHRAVHDAIRAVGGLDAFTQMMRQAEAHFGPGDNATLAASRHFVQVVLDAAGEFIGPAVTELAVDAPARRGRGGRALLLPRRRRGDGAHGPDQTVR